MQKTLISETAGSFGLFIDSEGNRVALHEGSAKSAVSGPVRVKAKAVGRSAEPGKKKAAAKKLRRR